MEFVIDYAGAFCAEGESLDEKIIQSNIIGALTRGAHPANELPYDITENLWDSGIVANVPNVRQIIKEMIGNQISIEPFGDISYARLTGKRDYI